MHGAGAAARHGTAGTDKAIQLVTSGAAANIAGAQTSNIYFGTYQQSAKDGGGYNVDPVKWRVLENNTMDKQLFLLADQNLDAVRYHEDADEPVTWERSTMRSWLNGYGATENNGDAGENETANQGIDYSGDSFLGTAFSTGEQAAIPAVPVDNSDNSNDPILSAPGGNNTTDKLFLLSIAEATTTAYGFTDSYLSTDVRKASNTDYAKSRGIYTDSSMGCGDWWLRSPSNQAAWAAYVYGNGNVNPNGGYVDRSNVGVRPAFHINLNSVLFTSAAAGGKAPEPLGVGDWCEVVNYTGSDWKLTLKDDSRNFAVSQTSVTAAYGDTSLELDYTGAAVGDNEYISAILADSSGNLLYYGRLAQPTSADGTVTVTVPDGLAAGSYTLKLFSEAFPAASR